ncbi:hypothetical protein CBR_g53966 [Chara braunii]|uniref:DUF659 domain-containing protein n=1 Tax=Chara braunii TaxID=69332 RepID=A0A388MBG3_CHABU|nr:hypothetical protein CBR_g53966 [Chara braunii]|eukprot:GBG91907.1 hypothetical protein CBR_g53966 [Chara braunii]
MRRPVSGGFVEGHASFYAVEVLQGWGDESSRGTLERRGLYTFMPSTAQRVQRWMADEGIRDTRAAAGGQRQRMDDAESDDIQDALDEEEAREGGAREGAVADEADEAVGEPNLPGEEVVMTLRGVGGAGPATRAPRAEVDRARREKRTVGQAGVEVPDTGREKRARQTTIDEMYAREKLAEFTDAWLQWIYVKKLPFNAFRGPEFQRVRQAAERVPRSIQFQFPSYRVTAGAGIPSQRAKVATMVSEVRATFRHSGATILSDGRKSRSGKPLVNFLAGGANGALLYATVARDGSVRDIADVVYRRWRAIILSFPAKDVIGFCTDSASNYTAAARRFATDPEPEIRRIIWLPCSTHVCNLMLSDIGTRVVWVNETIIHARALVRFIKSHSVAHTLFRKVSPRIQLVEPVETWFASVFLMLTCLKGRRDALESMLHGDAWAHIPWDRAHVSQAQWVQQRIRDGEFWQRVHYAILVMSPVHQLLRRMDRGGMMMSVVYEWSQHQLQLMSRVDVPTGMIKPCVREVAIRNLHMLEPAHAAAHLLNPRRRSLTYYHSLETTADDRCVVEERVAAAEPAVVLEDVHMWRFAWTTRGSSSHGEVFSTQAGVGRLGATTRPRGRPRMRRCPFTIVASLPPIIRSLHSPRRLGVRRGWRRQREETGHMTARIMGGRGLLPTLVSASLAVDAPHTGLRGHRAWWELGRFVCRPQDVRTDADVERGPVETEEERDARLDREEEERLRSLPQWVGRFTYLDEQRQQRDLETGAGGSRDVDDSGVPEEAVQGEFDYEGQDAAAGGGSGGGRRGDEETAGVPEGQDVVMGGGSPSGGRGDSETAGDEGQGAAVCGGGEGGPGGDGDTAGVGGDDGPNGDDDDDHGPEDDPYRLALVLRDPTLPPLHRDDTTHTFFDADALAHALTYDPFAHVSRKSGKQRAPGRVYSPPPFTVQSPHWSGSSLSDVRGRESGAGEVGSDRRSDDGRDSAGSMPPPPARTPEARVDTGDRTVAPGVAHSGGSPPPVRGGVGGGWSAVRRVGDRLRADYDAGRGVFTGRTPVQTQAAEGGSGRPSLQMTGRMLGLSRAETRRTLVLEAAGTSTDRLRGEQFTSGEEGLSMRRGTRRQHGLSEVEARLAAGVAAGQAALDAIQRERERGIAAQAEEDEDVDTESESIETAARRHRAQVAAAAAAAHAAGHGAQMPEGEEGAGEDRMAARPLREAARALVGDDDVRGVFCYSVV